MRLSEPKLVTAPTEEPVSVDEAQLALRLETDDLNSQLAKLIGAAREKVEADCNRQLCTATYDVWGQHFPCVREAVWLPKAPLQSVTWIKYYDTAGVEQTWSSANYIVDVAGPRGRIATTPSSYWPSTDGRINAVNIRFVCGYGAATAVPFALKRLIESLVQTNLDYSGDIISGSIISRVPHNYDLEIMPWKVLEAA